MKSGTRSLLIVLLVLVAVLLGVGGCFVARYRKMAATLRAAPVADVDLSQLADGVYTGTFSEFLVSATVRITVEERRITSVELMEQRCGPGYEAKETVERIVAAQSPKVDAVTGATGSSLCIMAAAYRALTEGR